ncbi:YciI family protein [Thiotrichales bacterium 19S3-7]|nr:YciI family protein [Thiotrichales bacterium 19S3-7]MCF6802012.1 YciI family protein [Thiotrichales bacterium 19S3-11]
MLYLIDITFKKSVDDVNLVLNEHRAYLRSFLTNNGLLLAAGPKTPRTGGILIAKGERSEIDQMIQNDPYHIHQVAEYKVTAFDPLTRQEFLSHWYV